MLPSLLASLGLFAVTSFGLAWPVVGRRTMAPGEKIVTTVALSLLGIYLWGWLIYVWELPRSLMWVLPLAAGAGLVFRLREMGATLRDATARASLIAYGVLTAWCLGWLGTVASYSGGGWVADWFEHWERAQFFLEHGPLDTRFIGRYTLAARPPLANVVEGAFLAITQIDFAHYQVFSTLLATLVLLPAALLAARWGGVRSIWILLAAMMLNPLVVENATFAWTKLPAAFFVLAACHFFLRARTEAEAPVPILLCGVCLAAGMLAHYSTGPYLVVLAIAWLALGWRTGASPSWRRHTLLAALASVAVLATWLGWALARLGSHTTFLTNPSVTSSDAQEGNQFVKIALNLFDTVVPHFLRSLDPSLIVQRSAWGAARDWFFQCYQINLLFMLGSVGWVVMGRELWRKGHTSTPSARAGWGLAIAAVIGLGVAVHGQRDHWGLAHICLQALGILGLAFLAARWNQLSRVWRLALGAGAVFDFIFGIALHFGVQSFALDRWFGGPNFPRLIFTSYSDPSTMNLNAKIAHRLAFFSDAMALPLWTWLVFLGLVAFGAAIGSRRSGAKPATE